MIGPTVRLCRCGCGKPLPPGLHGNTRNHPDCQTRIRQDQNRNATKRFREAARYHLSHKGQVAVWPDAHLPGIYGLEITAAAARLYEGARTHEYMLNDAFSGPSEYTDEDLAESAQQLREESEALLRALVRRLPAPDTDCLLDR